MAVVCGDCAAPTPRHDQERAPYAEHARCRLRATRATPAGLMPCSGPDAVCRRSQSAGAARQRLLGNGWGVPRRRTARACWRRSIRRPNVLRLDLSPSCSRGRLHLMKGLMMRGARRVEHRRMSRDLTKASRQKRRQVRTFILQRRVILRSACIEARTSAPASNFSTSTRILPIGGHGCGSSRRCRLPPVTDYCSVCADV
jgi:hypothetical protein